LAGTSTVKLSLGTPLKAPSWTVGGSLARLMMLFIPEQLLKKAFKENYLNITNLKKNFK
jgi:hypothetical protein